MKKVILIILFLILMICSSCNNNNSTKPDDFSFSFQFCFDGYYDSKTKELKNGFNYDLNKECIGTLELSVETLNIIYQKFMDVEFEKLPEFLQVSELSMEPTYHPYMEIRYGEVVHRVVVVNAHGTDWIGYEKLEELYDYLCDLIKESDVYKSLPENQKVYY